MVKGISKKELQKRKLNEPKTKSGKVRDHIWRGKNHLIFTGAHNKTSMQKEKKIRDKAGISYRYIKREGKTGKPVYLSYSSVSKKTKNPNYLVKYANRRLRRR